MDPLDLTKSPPRPPRARALNLMLLPRTIDKFRAELPAGNLGGYETDLPTGASYLMLRALGIGIDEFRRIVAAAKSENEVLAWVNDRLNPVLVAAINDRLEHTSINDLPPDQREQFLRVNPVGFDRPDLTNILDILEAEDERVFGRAFGTTQHS